MSSSTILSCIDQGEKFQITVAYNGKQFSLNDCKDCIEFIRNSTSIKIISEEKEEVCAS